MENRYKLKYDIKQRCISNIKFKQGDVDTSILEVQILDNSIPIDITGENIEFRFLKPDNTKVSQNSSTGVTILDAANGIVECTLKANTLAAVGKVRTEIVRKKDSLILTCPSFYFTVNSSIGNMVLSSNYIVSIENKIIEWQLDENLRQETFENNESVRQNKFNSNETNRQKTFDTNESNRKEEYKSFKKVIIGENAAADLQEQVNKVNSHLAQMANDKLSTLTKTENVFSLPNCADGQLSFSLKGRTIVNHVSCKDKIFEPSVNKILNIALKKPIEINKIYTLIINIKSISTSHMPRVSYYVLGGGEGNKTLPDVDLQSDKVLNNDNVCTGIYCLTFGFSAFGSGDRYLSFFNGEDEVSDGTVTIDAMVIEGNWKNYSIPYFDGIKSIGELNGNKIEVLNRNKNYFDINTNYNVVTPNTDYFYADGVLKVSNSDSNGTWRSIKIQKPIRLKAFTQYTISAKKNIIRGSDNCGYIGIKDLQGYNIKDLKGKDNYTTFITDKTGMVYLNFFSAGINAEIAEVEFTNIQLEEGTAVTEYEPYKQDKIDILFTHLFGIGSYIDEKGNISYGTKKVILDGNGYLITGSAINTNNTIAFEISCDDVIKISPVKTPPIICNKFNKYILDYLYREDIEGIGVCTRGFRIRINKSKLEPYGFVESDTSTYITAFKALLKVWYDEGNPLVVYYELAEPIVEQLPQPLTLQSFTNGSMVVNSTIPPILEVNYPTSFATGIMQNAEGVKQNRQEITSIYDLLLTMTKEIQNLKNGTTGA